MFCPKCGAELPDSAQFCGACGEKMDMSRVAAAAAADPAPTATAPAAAASAAGGAVAAKSRVPLIVGILAVVVVAAVVGVVVYFNFFAPYSLDEGTFPDSAVRSALASQADTDHDGKVSRDEAKALTSLDLSGSGVASLEGLDKFPNLAQLVLSSTASLQQADFSKTKGLVQLNIADSALSSVDVSMLENLQTLKADGAAITSLDVSHNAKLTSLSVDSDVAVSGVEATGVRAQYLMSWSYVDYTAFGYDLNGVGGNISSSETEFSYDDSNMLTNYVSTSYAGYDNSEYTNGRRYTYEDGRLVTSEAYRSTYSSDADVTYDSAGRVAEVYVSSGSGSSAYSTRYTFDYDDAGRLVKRTANSSGSGSTSTYSYSYNDAGQLVQSDYRYGSSTTNTVEFGYDQAGRIISVKSDYEELEFGYNDAGQLVTKNVYFLSDGKRVSGGVTVTFSYDQSGRLESATRTSGDSSFATTVTANVEYDENGLPYLVEREMHYDSNGNSNDYDGETIFEYTRVFTAKDAPDVQAAMVLGDPTTLPYSTTPLQFDVLGMDRQDPIAYYTCTQVMTQSNVVL